MSRELDAQEGVKIPADGAAKGESPAVRGERGPFSCLLDRRSFLQCALASGAALGVCEFSQLLVASPLWAGPQKQDDSRFTVEAKFYQKLQSKTIQCRQEDQVQAVSARMHSGRSGTRLLWRAGESRRNVLHAGALAGVRRAH